MFNDKPLHMNHDEYSTLYPVVNFIWKQNTPKHHALLLANHIRVA